MSALTGTVFLTPDLRVTADVHGDSPVSLLAAIRFGEHATYADLSLLASDPAQLDRLAEAARDAARLLRDRMAAEGAPATPVPTPVPQADAGAVEPAAAPAPRTTAHCRPPMRSPRGLPVSWPRLDDAGQECLMTTVADGRRVAELTKLPKAELVRRCEAAGELGGIHPLKAWSKHDLAVTLAHCEQTAGVS